MASIAEYLNMLSRASKGALMKIGVLRPAPGKKNATIHFSNNGEGLNGWHVTCMLLALLILCLTFGFLAGSFHHHVNVMPKVQAQAQAQAAQKRIGRTPLPTKQYGQAGDTDGAKAVTSILDKPTVVQRDVPDDVALANTAAEQINEPDEHVIGKPDEEHEGEQEERRDEDENDKPLRTGTGNLPVTTNGGCLNTCPTANNGVCDDGRGNRDKPWEPQEVRCDLGTDCHDCGPWVDWSHAFKPPHWIEAGGHGGPIEQLLSLGLSVRARKTQVDLTAVSSSRGFMAFAYTDPAVDWGVSQAMDRDNCVDLGLTKVVQTVLDNKCLVAGEQRRHVVDVGAGFGWFSVFAAHHGCRVIAYEKIKENRLFLEYNAALNNVSHLITITQEFLGFQAGQEVELVTPKHGPWREGGWDGLLLDRSKIGDDVSKIKVAVGRLDALQVETDILLMRVSQPGFDAQVLWGGMQLFIQKKVKNVLLDYAPNALAKAGRFTQVKEGIHLLDALIILGYRLGHVQDNPAHKTTEKWFSSITETYFAEITRHNLLYDFHDLELLQKFSLGCPLPKVLSQQYKAAWANCNMVPEDLNPRSFHSVIGQSTTVWGTLQHEHMSLREPVGVLPLEAADTAWKSPFWRDICDRLPMEKKVRNRCECTDKNSCGTEESIAESLAKSHELPSNYILPAPK